MTRDPAVPETAGACYEVKAKLPNPKTDDGCGLDWATERYTS